MEVAGEVVPRHPPPRGAHVPVDRVRVPDVRRRREHRVHRPLPARHLRLQRRRDAVDVARAALRVHPHDRSVPAVLDAAGRRLPGDARRRLPGAPVTPSRPPHPPAQSPPFSMQPDADFPATLDVDYPEHLSRGLVWVKWWLLAIPHYIVIALFQGGWHVAGGLISILAFIAGVNLALGRRYPDSIFDFVVGMHRWTWRGWGDAGLVRGEEPPVPVGNGGTGPRLGAPPSRLLPPGG